MTLALSQKECLSDSDKDDVAQVLGICMCLGGTVGKYEEYVGFD